MSEKVQASQLKPSKRACQMGVSTSSKINTTEGQLVSSFSSLLSKKLTFSPQSDHWILKGITDSSAGCKDPFILPKDAHEAFLSAHSPMHLSLPF